MSNQKYDNSISSEKKEIYRALAYLNIDHIVSILIKQFKDLDFNLKETYIDNRFSYDTISNFNKREFNPDNINDIIELCNYLQIEDTEMFIIKNSEPSCNYKIDETYLQDLNFPNFITNFTTKDKNIINQICKFGLFKQFKYAHENRCHWNEDT